VSLRRSIPVAILAGIALGCAHGREVRAPEPAPPVPTVTPPVASKAGPASAAQAERSLRLCALAPSQPSGLRTLDAVVVEGREDTLAVVDGRRLPLAAEVGPVRILGESAWATGRTLDLQVGAAVQRYRIYDVARVIEPGQLAYLGTADAVPVFAAAEDVAPVAAELARLQGAERELPMRLTDSAVLRARLRAIDVLYVPARATGCIFQPMLRVGAP
jgi:hypothetical protein